MIVDLHLHSTASDGQYSPAELVKLVKDCGVQVMALTDHDTTDGVAMAKEAGKSQGIRVLTGIELSASEHPNLHILGYGIDPAAPKLSSLCAELKHSREQHGQYIVDFLRAHGIQIDLQEVEALAAGGRIGRPHFAQVMVRHGYVRTTREAFDLYLDTEEYRSIKRKKPDVQTCIAVICDAGGKAVLAHPYQLEIENAELEALVAGLKSYGLCGLECHYPKYTPEQEKYYLYLADKYRLHVTAGSDFHGEQVHPEDCIRPVQLNIDWLLKSEGTI